MRESRFIAAIRRGFTGLSDFSREKRLHAIDSGELEEIVYDARQAVKGEFDVVFTTWGTICWLPDIVRWAETIASLFAPDGAFYFADAHPAMLVLEEREGRLVAKWAADTPIDEPLVFDEAQTYTGDPDAAHCVAHLPVDPFAAANSQGADSDRGSSSILFTSISGCPGRRFPCASGATTAPSTEGRACRAVGRITARHQAR